METANEVKNVAIEAAKAVSKGELPTNEQINETLEKTKKALHAKISELPANSRTLELAKGAETVISSAQSFWNEKNKDNRIQKFFSDSKRAVEDLSTTAKEELEETKKMKDQFGDVLSTSKDLAFALINHKEYRDLLLHGMELSQKLLFKIAKSKGGQQPVQSKYSLRRSSKRQKTSTKGKPKEAPSQISDKQVKKLTGELVEVLKKIAEKEEFRNATDNLWTLLDYARERVTEIASNPDLHPEHNKNLRKVMKDGKKILEGLAGEEPLDKLFTSVGDIFSSLGGDEKLTNYLKDWRKFMKSSFENVESLASKEGLAKVEELINTGKDLFESDKLRDVMNSAMDEAHDFLNRFSSDATREKFLGDVRHVVNSFVLDNNKPSLFALQRSLQEVKGLIMPIIFSHLESIPLPKLEGSTDTLDYSLENVTFSGKEILPEHINISLTSNVDLNVKDLANDATRAELAIEVRNIKTSLRDVHFHYKRKEFPRIKDDGVADISLTGDGTRLYIKWVIESENRGPLQITAAEALCEVDKLNINVKEAYHDVLASVLTTLFSGYLKDEIERQIETSLINMSTAMAMEFNDVFKSYSKEEVPTAK